jgi:hypothetical protein
MFEKIETKNGKKVATLKLPNGNTVRLTKRDPDQADEASSTVADLREHRERIAQSMVDQTVAKLQGVIEEVQSLTAAVTKAHEDSQRSKSAYTFKINRDSSGLMKTVDVKPEVS